MQTDDAELGTVENGLAGAAGGPHELRAVEVYPARDRPRRREGNDPSRKAGRDRGAAPVEGVEEKAVAGAAVLHDPLLVPVVILDVAVPVEMIGRQIENARDLGMEVRDGLELEARDLEHEEIAGAEIADDRAERQTNVSADDRPPSGGSQDLADHRDGRRLAVRARDGDEARLGEPAAELELARERHAAPRRLEQKRMIDRDAGADDDLVDAVEELRAETAEAHGHAGDIVRNRRERVLVGAGDAGARSAEEPDRREPAPREAEHENRFAPVTRVSFRSCHRSARSPVRHCSLSVLMLRSASSAAIIQNRTTTFSSLQPMSSK